jgi:hypothetical protein
LNSKKGMNSVVPGGPRAEFLGLSFGVFSNTIPGRDASIHAPAAVASTLGTGAAAAVVLASPDVVGTLLGGYTAT